MAIDPSAPDETERNFEGHEPRRCGEHRTVGSHRAWCYQDAEWCYPSDGCAGCKPDVDDLMEEVATLRAELAELKAGREAVATGVCLCRFGSTCDVCGPPPKLDEPIPAQFCAHHCDDTFFDRTLCAPPCDVMHTRCRGCHKPLDPCAHSVDRSTPHPPPWPVRWTHPPDEQCVHCATPERLTSPDPVIDCPREECPFDGVLTSQKPDQNFDKDCARCGFDRHHHTVNDGAYREFEEGNDA